MFQSTAHIKNNITTKKYIIKSKYICVGPRHLCGVKMRPKTLYCGFSDNKLQSILKFGASDRESPAPLALMQMQKNNHWLQVYQA